MALKHKGTRDREVDRGFLKLPASLIRYKLDRLPRNKLKINEIKATTSRIWMKSPATWKENPNTQNSKMMTNMAHSIAIIPFRRLIIVPVYSY